MLKYVSMAVKIQLNVHDLNNETVAGNVTDIRMMEFLDEEGNKKETPCVSGRMLKHWHYEGVRSLINEGRYSSLPLCAGCKVGEPIRPAEIKNGKITQISKSESDIISFCTICDIHGYLIAQGATEGEQRGKSARRTSRAMFSWLIPVVDKESISKQVIHNRVSSDPEAMMPFNKSYVSGIYGFVSALDIGRIGLVELNLSSQDPYAIDDNNCKERMKVAIEAYRYLISGQIGASLSHAIPHWKPIEVLICLSEEGPLPFCVSPVYSDYIPKTVGILPKSTEIFYWGEEDTLGGVVKKNTINEIFEEILNKI
ncbi:MAG TPA: DevR family CRISPR-associated autoregulator [Candidatus Omnitrophica bacterium]|nr:DevR family CRISPR-associated autoregulator [Candidatus Omnitrophota bacterium]